MRILSVGNFGRSWDGSICDEEHIAKALEDLDHEVIRHQREGQGFPSVDYDFTLIAQWDGYDIEYIKTLPRPLVYWAFDYQADGQEWHERLVKQANLYLSKPLSDSKYPNWQWLSQQFAPDFLDRYISPISVEDYERPPSGKDIDVLFTGSYLPWATERIETLRAIDKHFKLTIHSFTPSGWEQEGFKDVRGPIMDYELPELVARAKLNIAIDHTITPGYWSDRAAQTMACGGFVLHRYVPLMEVIFRQKLGYFYNVEDCLTKISSYLSMPLEDMELMANIGYTYAHEELMVTNTVHNLLTIVEGIL